MNIEDESVAICKFVFYVIQSLVSNLAAELVSLCSFNADLGVPPGSLGTEVGVPPGTLIPRSVWLEQARSL